MSTKSYLEPQDIGCLTSAAGNLRDKLLATTLFHLGCRVSEALGVTADDIDLNNRTVNIKHLKSRIKLNVLNAVQLSVWQRSSARNVGTRSRQRSKS
ncbi:Phage integrase family [Dehalogenimonas alkenigignens]|uniref:Phage integrase family n=1 Tax=Dehalogenimonas alkenigignens TaxID=1217799 RepID=A0A0W0GH04_9CHLR|nr:tyrosine-type recombinase/integrase [Dehalogenimonas alkenigignens]KTB47825.1 Phage integrase family [Dehalogenimonas alkenigignens]